MRKLKKALAKLDDFRAAWFVCLFLLAGLLVCVGVAWLFPGLYGPAFGPAYAVRRQAAQAVFEYGGKTLIGVSWVVTLYVAFQRIVSSDMNLSLTKKAQLEVRFAKAVEFLGEASEPGKANATAAVSAITLLESVVREDGESYGRLVFEVLGL